MLRQPELILLTVSVANAFLLRRRNRGGRIVKLAAGEGAIDAGGSPQATLERFLHLLWDEQSPTKRTGSLVMVHPPVETSPMKHMAAVAQPPDFLPFFKLVETNGAAIGHRSPATFPFSFKKLVKADDGENFLNEDCGSRAELRRKVGVRPGDFRFEEVAEAGDGEDGGDEAAEEVEEEDEMKDEFGKEEVGVTDGEAHG
ncbi:hypothetical protein IEQ34_022313 [Dendrobium chrysotoxum]|uniref:Uncharacterized protein n=1 Tax=Dendrobium chrysotoxum TaxID=161865 RepID=A0AAV7FYH5_DENCH|nr:hypothetical protein IEQ34_022313 [Dendrobium chrysotoxum]